MKAFRHVHVLPRPVGGHRLLVPVDAVPHLRAGLLLACRQRDGPGRNAEIQAEGVHQPSQRVHRVRGGYAAVVQCRIVRGRPVCAQRPYVVPAAQQGQRHDVARAVRVPVCVVRIPKAPGRNDESGGAHAVHVVHMYRVRLLHLGGVLHASGLTDRFRRSHAAENGRHRPGLLHGVCVRHGVRVAYRRMVYEMGGRHGHAGKPPRIVAGVVSV